MVNTVSIKGQQLANGYFEIGSGSEKVLIMGSCRVAPYVEYLNEWNIVNGNRFTIYSLDPFNFNWDTKDDRCDYEQALLKWENDERMLAMLSSVDIFIHEFYKNSGFFNVDMGDNKTIYQFGMKPNIDVCLPNFNDNFILTKDIVNFDLNIRKKVIQDMTVIGKLSVQTLKDMYLVSSNGIQRFYDVCGLSDMPEMKWYFEENFRRVRLWQTYNHISKNFSTAVFRLLDKKFIELNLDESFFDDKPDMFESNFTPLTQYDIDYYAYSWNEELKPIL